MDFLLLGKEPISTDQPSGSDIRYDVSFDELQVEIDKLSSPTAGSIDWEKVVQLSSPILKEKSKDLLVASYLAVALIYTQKLNGVAIGVQIYRDILENYWETLFPLKTRMRGRLGALEWWIEKTADALEQLKETTFQKDIFYSFKENCERIEDFLNQNLDEPPSFASLRDLLSSLHVESEEVQEEVPPVTQPAGESTAESMPRQQKTGVSVSEKADALKEMTSLREAERLLAEMFQKIRTIAAYLWQQDLTNPLPYRLSRITAWSSIEGLPPSNDGQTRIPSPQPQVKNILYELKAKGDYEALLRSAEERLSQFIFWIDLNRLVSEAMHHMGSQYERAREAVRQETGFLIHRLTGLEDLVFSDGTPFADSETKQWLKGIVLEVGSTQAAHPSFTGADPTDSENTIREKEIAESLQLIKEGNLLGAVEGLQERVHNSYSAREKLLWRLGLARVLINTNYIKLALPHLYQILKDIDLYRLEEYDPAVALQGLKLSWFGFEAGDDQISKEQAGNILGRMAKLDLGEVIRLSKGLGKKNK